MIADIFESIKELESSIQKKAQKRHWKNYSLRPWRFKLCALCVKKSSRPKTDPQRRKDKEFNAKDAKSERKDRKVKKKY